MHIDRNPVMLERQIIERQQETQQRQKQSMLLETMGVKLPLISPLVALGLVLSIVIVIGVVLVALGWLG